MNKIYKQKIQRLYELAPWAAYLYWLVVKFIKFSHATVDFWYYLNFNFPHFSRPFFRRTVQRAHYIGSDIQRPHKLAAALLLGVLMGGVVAARNIQDMMAWIVVWGTVFSTIVIFKSIKRWLFIMSYIGPNRKKAI